MKIKYYQSPVGTLLLGVLEGRLVLCEWNVPERLARASRALDRQFTVGSDPLLDEAACQLDEFFAGERRGFDLPLFMSGTEFQQSVWRELDRIPYGTTLTYGELARRVGRPDAVRAVASAVGANRLSVILPCHRVVGAHGALGGYAGGLDAKRYLLDLERH